MMFFRCVAATTLLVCLSGSAFAITKASKPTLRDEEQAACYGDANRLCKDFIPNEEQITACMKEKFAQVSKGCKKFFK